MSCVVSGIAVVGSISAPVLGQIIADDTLPNSSQSRRTAENVIEIGEGTDVGPNRFHSFREFNVGAGETVFFLNPAGILNIISRVTGSNESRIDGSLVVGSEAEVGAANLYLLNPNGVIFGEGARLDIDGSLSVTTAEAISFEDGLRYGVSDLESGAILSMTAPLGVQFGSTAQGDIRVSGLLSADGDISLFGRDILLEESSDPDLEFETELAAGQDLTIVSQGVIRGRGVGLVGDEEEEFTRRFDLKSDNGGNIILNAAAAVDLENVGVLLGPGEIEPGETGEIGSLEISAGEGDLTLRALSLTTDASEFNGGGVLFTSLEGDVLIERSTLTFTLSEGDSAPKVIRAAQGEIVLDETSLITVTSGGAAAGSFLFDSAEGLALQNQSQINSATIGEGSGGNIEIVNAQLVRLDDGAQITTGSEGVGDAGNIFLRDIGLLLMRRGSRIEAGASTSGSGGDVTIDAVFAIAVPNENSDILADTNTSAGGNIQITAERVIGFREVQLFSADLRDNGISDISAASNRGVPGEVTIDNLAVDPTQGLSALPVALTDDADQIAEGCRANQRDGSQSEFVVTGRGGLSARPGDPLSADAAPVPWVTIPEEETAAAIAPFYEEPLLREAQGWTINAAGQTVFVAEPDDQSSYQSSRWGKDLCVAVVEPQGLKQ